MTDVVSLPPPYVGSESPGLVVASDGVWIVAVAEANPPAFTPRQLLHFSGNAWTVHPLGGLSVAALARGPDGKVRMLSTGATSAVYVVEERGRTKELDLPEGVYLNDLVAAGANFYAVGVSGATLQLVTPGTR